MESKSIGVSKLALPTGGGAIRGIGETFHSNDFTGTASLSIPIPTSACRGFEPHLSLDYSSGSGNGIFGIGFSLSLPNISRKTSRAIPKYDDTDTLVFSHAEDLVPVKGDPRSVEGGAYSVISYRPRTEGLFARIEKWVNSTNGDTHWRVTTIDNVTSIFGQSPVARIADPDDQTRVFQWLIERTYDARGNQTIYEYLADSGNKHISRIKYGNDRPGKTADSKTYWHFEVGFEYSKPAIANNLARDDETGSNRPRPDPFSSYKPGFELRTSIRCIGISMFHRFKSVAQGELLKVSAINFEYDARSTMTFLQTVEHLGYREGATKAMPPLAFTWSKSRLGEKPDTASAEASGFKPLKLGAGFTIPGFLERGAHQMVDLYGEGLPGILYTDADAVLYARPLGDADFASHAAPHSFPIERDLQGGQSTLTDLGGEGKLDLVVTTPSRAGYYESGRNDTWEPYRSFPSIPTDLHDPERQMVDVTGDGLADLLLFMEDAVKFYPSRGKLGYGQPLIRSTESMLPVTSNSSAREAIHFTDLFGDGGSHLVRIRQGSVECWPNLGYGRFGSRVEMANAPRFDGELDVSRLFLTDIDGSGATDLVYAYPDHIDIYRNDSGNRFSDAVSIPLPRAWNDHTQISLADVLGNGTACLVFTSLNSDLSLDHQYYDFTEGVKPYLLTAIDNNMGATTIVHYSPSTKFYLADEKAGTPWMTRLPFPVQVVDKVETIDHLGGSRLVAKFTYHHGYFDPIDREFRGFGRVERMDTESFEDASTAEAGGGSLDVPPVLTKTWYHTGAEAESRLSQQYAAEYYQGDGQAELLPDATLDPAFLENPDNLSEAYHALFGQVLREEVYGLDHKQNADLKNPNLDEHPYTVTESTFDVRLIQPKGDRQYAVCLVHARETISYHYERNPADPRIDHELTLKVDEFGNVLKALAIGYGHRTGSTDAVLTADDKARQSQLLITYAENVFTNSVLTEDDYLAPLPCEVLTFELTGYTPENKAERFSFDEWRRNDFALLSRAQEIPYEQTANNNTTQKRMIEQVRTLYRSDDLSTFLAPGVVEPLAMHGESYHLVFTPGMLDQVYVRNGQKLLPTNPADVLAGGGTDRGGYVDLDSDGHWWIPTGRIFLSANSGDTAAQEQAYAQQHFFLPLRTRNPFHTDAASTESFVTYDDYDLLIVETRDALGNTVKSDNDYRVLQPILVTDPNGNRLAAAFDALGMVIATAVMGKEGENLGDLLEDYDAEPPLAELQAFSADPHARAASMLGKATTRIVYDLDRYQRAGQPPFAAMLARETHSSDLLSSQALHIQISFAYSDGFGRELQAKVQAEAGDAPLRTASVQGPSGDVSPGPLKLDNSLPVPGPANPRWVGTGRTVYNNKGKPVKQYEPFFSSTHLHEVESEMTDTGVSPVLFYDPAERVVATLHPDNTFEKVIFDPWQQTTWDANDTVSLDPRTDVDINGYTAGYFKTQPVDWKTWLQQLGVDPTNPPADTPALSPEKKAAVHTLPHAGTPTVAYFDALGRAFLTVTDNGKDPKGQPQKYRTLSELDIEGNHRTLIDALDRVAMRYDYDLLGARIHQLSMDAGERWMLNDVMGQPLYAWDSRNYQFRTAYDQLRRPTDSFLSEGPAVELLVARTLYGEGQSNPEARNLRGQPVQIFDQAGVVTYLAYDFKSNLLSSTRQLARDYKATPNWSKSPPSLLETESFVSSTLYDALNRPIQIVAPRSNQANAKINIIRPGYSEANLLKLVDVWLGQTAEPSDLLDPPSATLHAVTNINYDARRQRTGIDYGNSARTSYTYDPNTFRLIRLQTLRGNAPLQDLHYTFDPVGNIAHIEDDAQQTSFFSNQVVAPQCDYTYDAVYRLTEATGREHIGQLAQPQTTWNGESRLNQPQPGDGQAMRNYAEQYFYDAVDNIEQLIHQASGGNWTRAYAYNEPSPLEAGKQSNRLSNTTVGATKEPYSYDAHGNMTGMTHLPLMQWDYRDQLQATAQQVINNGGTSETTWYVYDGSGQRVRQVTDSQAGAGQTAKRKSERIYLGSLEVYRGFQNDGATVELERETLHIMDDEQRVALVETRTQGNDKSPAHLIRYQFDNHLGSATLELDDQAQIISYEEYAPFGSTSYQAVRSQTETPKRYRYSGKERDDSTGFYYYGARYYAPWLGRWTSPDPAGMVDGLNLYVFVSGNPLSYVDRLGLCKKLKLKKKGAASGVTVAPLFAEEMKRRETIKPPAAVLKSPPKLKKGRYLKAVYDKASKTATYFWFKESLKERFPDVDEYKYVKQEIRKKPIKANESIGRGLKVNTSVSKKDKMGTASDPWVRKNWEELGKDEPMPMNPKGKTVAIARALRIIEPPQLFPYHTGRKKPAGVKRANTEISTPDTLGDQHVDEWASRGHRGSTVRNDPDQEYRNQGPLNGFVNTTYGGGEGALSRKHPNQDIVRFAAEFV